jgi:hypothetical protein
VSDRGRPQFLPPEEPSEPAEEPGLLPGLSDSSAPAGPPRPVLLVAAGVVVFLLVGGALFLVSDRNTSSPTGVPSAALGPDYVSTPDACTAIGRALPADVRSAKPLRLRESCRWEVLRRDHSRSLEVAFQLEASDVRTGTSGTVKAARDFADDLDFSADGSRNGGFQSAPERIDGLGDEAFAARSLDLVVAGRTEKDATSYDMGGAQVEVRRLNVVLTVKWRGADYPRRVRGHKKLVGTRLPYAQAKRQATAMATVLLSALH